MLFHKPLCTKQTHPATSVRKNAAWQRSGGSTRFALLPIFLNSPLVCSPMWSIVITKPHAVEQVCILRAVLVAKKGENVNISPDISTELTAIKIMAASRSKSIAIKHPFVNVSRPLGRLRYHFQFRP